MSATKGGRRWSPREGSGAEERLTTPGWTILVPYVPAPYATEWHPPEATGPFKVLCRGFFPTVGAAIEWAREHLGGAPYSLREEKQ